jgi:hypothetical protein
MTTEERMDWWFENNKPNRDVCDHIDDQSAYGKGVYFDSVGVPTRTREPFPLPRLKIKQSINTEPGILLKPEFWHSDDFIIENYQSHTTIKAPLSN